MSADNVVYVTETDGKWYVWEDYLSNTCPIPADNSLVFEDRTQALKAAFSVCDDIGHVEHGVSVI